MKIKGYKRIKKIDIKKWLLGGNSKIYAIILILFLAAVLFVFKTVKSMNSSKTVEITDETTDTTSASKEDSYIANNQKYLIKINKSKNFVCVYTVDDNMQYSILQDSFWCSVNSSVKEEKTFITDKSVWFKINGSAYGHYANHLDNGAWIYSVPYYSQDITKLNVSLYNMLGQPTQTGSICVEAGKARWIYENCGNNTRVEIYEDSTEQYPQGLSELETLSNNETFDPSDKERVEEGVCPTPINYMSVVNGKVIKAGTEFNPMEGASAFDIYGKDISSYIQVVGMVDNNKAGVYSLYYNISDSFGKKLSYYREVTVTE